MHHGINRIYLFLTFSSTDEDDEEIERLFYDYDSADDDSRSFSLSLSMESHNSSLCLSLDESKAISDRDCDAWMELLSSHASDSLSRKSSEEPMSLSSEED